TVPLHLGGEDVPLPNLDVSLGQIRVVGSGVAGASAHTAGPGSGPGAAPPHLIVVLEGRVRAQVHAHQVDRVWRNIRVVRVHRRRNNLDRQGVRQAAVEGEVTLDPVDLEDDVLAKTLRVIHTDDVTKLDAGITRDR